VTTDKDKYVISNREGRDEFFDWTETGVLDPKKYTTYRFIIEIKSPTELAFSKHKVYHMAKRVTNYINMWQSQSGNELGTFVASAILAKEEKE